MNSQLKNALAEYLLALADDELILGHRDSEWCGRAPIIEEDIAYANIALDEIGHASLWYQTIAGLLGEDESTYPDRVVYQRKAGEYRCAQIVELPNGDWAFTMLRQFLMDSLEVVRLDLLIEFSYPPIAAVAERIRKEESYHQRHTRAWILRLGQGTEESSRRLQTALDSLWPYTSQLLTELPNETVLVEAGYIPSGERIRRAWEKLIFPILEESGLVIPTDQAQESQPRSEHTKYLEILLAEMQSVPQMDPGANW